jgi:hypothetical protein
MSILTFHKSAVSAYLGPLQVYFGVCRFEGQISGKNIEIGIIGADKQFRHALS